MKFSSSSRRAGRRSGSMDRKPARQFRPPWTSEERRYNRSADILSARFVLRRPRAALRAEKRLADKMSALLLMCYDFLVFSLNPAFVDLAVPASSDPLALAQQGDGDAFCELCHAYETPLLRQAMKLCGDSALAEDLAQD